MQHLTDHLAALIARHGPIPLARFMAEANAAYYASRDPLGAAGDFITAPEISQMFGELIGLALADLWQRAGRPDAAYVELGPGRGTLAADALRAMRAAGLTPPVHLVEISPALRTAQAERVPHAEWHDDVARLPGDRPLLIVANEFFDALPVHHYVRTAAGWRERMVAHGPEGFHPVPGDAPADALVPERLRDAPEGSLFERASLSEAIVGALAARLAAQGGAALIIDYGHAGPTLGDTLQAVRAHRYADPFADPGAQDLTAHVDFTALAHAARSHGVTASRLVSQGSWLETLGLAARAQSLAGRNPARALEFAEARRRLCAEEEMGTLFKVLALTAPGWPPMAGTD